jgi:hypothetical protein
MDEKTREEIQKELNRQKFIKSGVEAKILKLQAQLDTGMLKHTKNRQKQAKTGEKQVKNIPKTPEKQQETKKEMGFFETILS